MKHFLALTMIVGLLGGCAKNEPAKNELSETYAGAAAMGSFCDRLPRPAYAAYQKHQTSNDWFEVYEVEPNIWAIYEPFQW